MAKLFTTEQARGWLRENNLKDAQSIMNAFVGEIKDVLQEALEEEMNHELGYSKYDWKNKHTDNSRNGHTKKRVRSQFGEIDLKIPGLEVSAEMVTRITDKILPIAKEWQNRALSELYPIIFLDGIIFNVNQDGQVVKKTAYTVFAITLEGRKDVLGIWIGEAESAKFWMNILSDLRNRGVQDILIACVDGLTGFEEAIGSIFPKTEIQQCVVHQIRSSTKFVNYKDRKSFCADMREIYTAANEEDGLAALNRFEEKWSDKYSYAIRSWRNNWQSLSTFFKYPPEIRRLIYTTNLIESFHRQIWKVTKNKGSFPTDDSLFKILYLIVMDATEKWTMPLHNWGQILNQLQIYFGERIDAHL